MRDVHETFAWVVIGGNAIAGAWALAAHWLEPLRVRALWIVTALAQIAIIVQIGLGVIALNQDDVEAQSMHQFYGFVAVATVGIIYSYRAQLAAQRYLLYGFGGLFLMGLGLRAVQLA